MTETWGRKGSDGSSLEIAEMSALENILTVEPEQNESKILRGVGLSSGGGVLIDQ